MLILYHCVDESVVDPDTLSILEWSLKTGFAVNSLVHLGEDRLKTVRFSQELALTGASILGVRQQCIRDVLNDVKSSNDATPCSLPST